MEFNFSIYRIGQLVILLTLFWLLDGFVIPDIPDGSFYDSGRMAKAWRYCILLFLGGAVCATLIDHYVGNFERSNIRLAYVVLGAVMMAGSHLWLRGLREAAETA